MEPVGLLGAHTSYTVHTLTRQVFLGCCNEVWAHRFPSPPFGSLFILSPSHTSFPLSFHVFSWFMSFHLTPFVFCAYNGPGLSVYANIYFQLRFQVAQVSTMRFHRLSLCIWFLLHHNHTHFCPVSSSFSCLHPFVLAARTFAHSS